MIRRSSRSDLDRRGVACGVGAHVIWGLFPAFWPLLDPASPIEVLAHRIVWTLVLMAVVLALVGGWRELRSLPARGWAMVTAAAVLIAANWGLFIYGVAIGHVVDRVGYYVGPLVRRPFLGVLVSASRCPRSAGSRWVSCARLPGSVQRRPRGSATAGRHVRPVLR